MDLLEEFLDTRNMFPKSDTSSTVHFVNKGWFEGGKGVPVLAVCGELVHNGQHWEAFFDTETTMNSYSTGVSCEDCKQHPEYAMVCLRKLNG
jgi:hypothetical protein